MYVTRNARGGRYSSQGTCLRVKDGHLEGRYDLGAVLPPDRDPAGLHHWRPIDVVVWCAEPVNDVTVEDRLERPVQIPPSAIAPFMESSLYRGELARQFMTEAAYATDAHFSNRVEFFRTLGEAAPGVRCISLPYRQKVHMRADALAQDVVALLRSRHGGSGYTENNG